MPKEAATEQKSYESPRVPSGQLQEIFDLAESFRAAEHAPAVRLDHFLLATVLTQYPPAAENVLTVFAKVRDDWLRDTVG